MSTPGSSQSGSPVYRGYDRAEVDRQYNNHQRFPRYKDIFVARQSRSAAARAKLAVKSDVAYGPQATERLDIFPAEPARPDLRLPPRRLLAIPGQE
jgi:hypothetical protein